MNTRPKRYYEELQRRNNNGLMESIEVRQLIHNLETAETQLATTKQRLGRLQDSLHHVPRALRDLMHLVNEATDESRTGVT